MNNRRGILFLVLAALLGSGAFWAAQSWMADRSPEAEVEAIEVVQVVVARENLGLATTLTRFVLVTNSWPKEHVPPGMVFDVASLEGRVLRRAVVAGEPIFESALFEVGSAGGLRAVISPNRRAVSVKVDSVIGLAGFVRPGAHVDVLATLRRIDQKRALPYSKVILQDVPVLAVDQEIEEPMDGGAAKQINVVTLEVTPEDAEQLVYAAHEGRIQLALRTPGDAEVVATKSVGVGDLLGERKKAPVRTARVGTRIQVLRGSKVEFKAF